MVSPRRFDPERHRALTEGKVEKEREIAALRHGAVGVETCMHTAHTHRTASATSTAPHARSAGHRGCAPIAPPTASHSRSVACRVTPSVGDRVSSMTFDPAAATVSLGTSLTRLAGRVAVSVTRARGTPCRSREGERRRSCCTAALHTYSQVPGPNGPLCRRVRRRVTEVNSTHETTASHFGRWTVQHTT